MSKMWCFLSIYKVLWVSGLEYVLSFLCLTYKTTEMGWSFEWNRTNRLPVAGLVKHHKDPSLLKFFKPRPLVEMFQSFTGNGDVSICARYSLARHTTNF